MASLWLEDDLQFRLRIGGTVSRARGGEALVHTWQGRARVGVAINDQQRARSDEREHRGAVKGAVNARHHAVVEAAHERGVDHFALVLRGGLDGGLEGVHARTPALVVQRPLEALHPDARHDDGDARVGGGGEVAFHPALGEPDEADARGVHVVARAEVIHEPHHVPRRVVEERELLAAEPRVEHRLVILGGTAARLRARAVVPPINRHREEAALGEVVQQRQLVLFVRTRAVQHDDNGPTPFRLAAFHQQARHADAHLCSEGKVRHAQAVRAGGRFDFGSQLDARSVEELEEGGAGVAGFGSARDANGADTEEEQQ